MSTECCEIAEEMGTSCCGGVSGLAASSEGVSRVMWRLGVAIVLAGQSMVFGLGINITPPPFKTPVYWALHSGLLLASLVVMGLLGGPLFRETRRAIKLRKVTVEGLFLVSMGGALMGSLIATITGEGAIYYEVVSIVLVVYTVGKLLGVRSRKKAVDEANRMREVFDYAYVLRKGGGRERVPIAKVGCCCEVSVGPGDAVTVDGVILEGEGFVKETAMTGELEPVVRGKGAFILAGSYSVDGTFKIKPTALKGERRIDDLLRTVEEAQLAPSALQEQADKIMRWFLPLVVAVSVGTFVAWVGLGTWVNALFNSMAVLLVACPCALGLATPLAVWSGLWRLSSLGLVSRSGEFLDTLARVDRVVFDKTGTLSEASLVLVDFVAMPAYKGREEMLEEMIVLVESQIEHPVAHALSKWGKSNQPQKYELVASKTVPGNGVEAELVEVASGLQQTVRIGERSFMPRAEAFSWEELSKKTIYISVNGEPAAVVLLEERIREEVQTTLRALKSLGIKGAILTGDSHEHWGTIEGIKVEYGLSPEEKSKQVQAFRDKGEYLVYIGDGVNDAGAMALSTGAIAMGEGAALAQSTASAVLMGNTLEVLPQAVKICRGIRKSVRGNMIFAVCYNGIGMSLAAAGILHPVVAALLMVVSSACVSTRVIRAVNQA